MVRVALHPEKTARTPSFFSFFVLLLFVFSFRFAPVCCSSFFFFLLFAKPRFFPVTRATSLARAGNGRNIEGSRIRMNTLKRGNKKRRGGLALPRRNFGNGQTGGNGETRDPPRINNALGTRGNEHAGTKQE